MENFKTFSQDSGAKAVRSSAENAKPLKELLVASGPPCGH